MCLAVPARIQSVVDQEAVVETAGITKTIDVSLTPTAKPGDWVIVHVGFALEIIDDAKAQETLAAMAAVAKKTKEAPWP